MPARPIRLTVEQVNESASSAPRLILARVARYLFIAVAAFLLLCGIGAVAVPLVIQHVVLDRLGDAIGRQVTIERTRFNPFKLTLTASGVRVAEQDGAADFVTIERVLADLSISSVRHLAPVIEALRIEAPVMRLQRTDPARFNFSDIADRLAAAPAEPEAERARFVLRNVELVGGEISFDDRVLEQAHRVTDLQLGIPLISSLEPAATSAIEPALSGLVNGSPLRIAGMSLPFSENRATTLDVALRDLQIATYLPLSPVALGFSVPKGQLSVELKVQLAQEAGRNALTITGSSRVDDLQIDARGGPRLAQAKRIELGLAGVEPLDSRYVFGDLEVEGLAVHITRGRDGELALVRAFSGDRQARKPPPPDPASAAATASGDRGRVDGPGGEPLEWSIAKTVLRDGQVAWRDEAVEPAVVLDHRQISIDIAEIGNRQRAPASVRLSLKQNETSSLTWQGEVDLAKSRAGGRVEARVASIAPYLPYVGDALAARVDSGALATQGDLDIGWSDGFTLEAANAQASVERASLTLAGDKQPAVTVGRFSVDDVAVSLAKRTLRAGRARLSGADIQVERDAQGSLNLQRLAAAPGAGATPAAGGEAGGGNRSGGHADAAPSWKVTIDKLDLEANQVAWRDLGTPKPVSLPLTQLSGSLGPVGTDLAAKSSVDLQARVGNGGTLQARGNFTVEPVAAQLDIQLQRLALAGFDPYLAERLALGIDEGSLDTRGTLRYEGGRVAYTGGLEVAGLRSRERESALETIRWKRLLVDGIDVDVDPTKLGPEDRVTIGAITLSDFFARVLLSEEGRFNLQDIVHTEASAQARERSQARARSRQEGTAGAPRPDSEAARKAPEGDGGARKAPDRSPAPAGGDEGAPPPAAQKGADGRRTAAVPSGSAARTKPGSAAANGGQAAHGAGNAGPVIRLGSIRLEHGRSNFTDRFVRPNYSVNLTDLEGGLSSMASDKRQPSDVALTGRVDGNAQIDISGKLDPLGPALFADIRAKANGIDLPTLTPYSVKYIGYAIEKGKLTLDVRYHIEGERLEAQNRIVLDQLTLGEKVESPDATDLPIQFALGLLKNSRGEIDLNLPIEGSLNDPQFSIGGIIGNAIGNLLTRVVTAPFAALASAFGGGKEELSYVQFQPGAARLTKESLQRLKVMAKALLERPALKLEIAGRVDPEAEQEAIRRERLDARLRALKRREAGEAAQPGESQQRQEEAATAAGVNVTPEELPVLLQRLYDESDLPGKPRNAIGTVRRPEVPDMEKLLLASIEVDADAVRRLGTRRAQTVQRWLAAQGKVPEDRMFVLAPRIDPSQAGPNQSKPQCTAACAEFSLR
jgi:hypothetical protein